MRKKHLEYIVDPLDNSKLELVVFSKKDKHIISGELIGKSNNYPIINGIPRILTGELHKDLLLMHIDFYNSFKSYISDKLSSQWDQVVLKIENLDGFLLHQKKTSESFSFEWNEIYKENNYEKQNFIHFLDGNKAEKDFLGKITLDVGCGSGRFTKQAGKFGSKIAYGVDLSEAVELSFKITKDQENVCIIQSDIYNLPFDKSIDLAYSIGVLHHLPDPKKGFESIVNKVLINSGEFLIWVYSRKNNIRALYFYEPVRVISNKINKKLLLKLCHFPALIVQSFNIATKLFNKIGLKKIGEEIPFNYYENFPYNMKLNDAFDVLATPKSNYYFLEDIRKWYIDSSLNNIRGRYLKEAGITFIGKK